MPLIRVRHQGRKGNYSLPIASRCKKWLGAAARELNLDVTQEISLLLCDGPTIRRLNRDWRGKDQATDVLSFPLHDLKPGERPGPGALGDIVVALPVARRDAKELARNFEAHLRHLLVHGLLHLLGFDHNMARETRVMEREEGRILARL